MQKITSLQYQDLIWLLRFAKAIFLGTISPIWGKAENGGMVEDSFVFRNRDEAQFLKVGGFFSEPSGNEQLMQFMTKCPSLII